MSIAVVTGASSGLGIEYVKVILSRFSDISEILVIARRKDRLEALSSLSDKIKITPVPLDLTKDESFEKYEALLNEKSENVKILVNNSGFGTLADFRDEKYNTQTSMIDLNVKALTALSSITLKYMKKGSMIINVCSIASFVPTPRMAVYCSTKAFVLSFSKALHKEEKKNGITVLAVCPGPMDTEFLDVANVTGNSKTFDMLPRVLPKTVAEKSVSAAIKGRNVYTNRAFYKFYRVLGKLLPHAWLMNFTRV